MALNCFGDLKKKEIVLQLRERGCNVQNVHELNLIMERMGLLIHSGNWWLTDTSDHFMEQYGKRLKGSSSRSSVQQALIGVSNWFKNAKKP